MIWRTFASVFPRQSPSSLILSSINAEADSTGIRLFMCSSKLAAILAVELLQGEASSGRHLVGAILSKKVAERHGLSTSIIPKGQVQERRQTEWLGRSLEFGQTDCKCNRLSECPERCESSEQSNVWWHYSYASSPLLLVFHTELLGVLRVQPLPAADMHRVSSSDEA